MSSKNIEEPTTSVQHVQVPDPTDFKDLKPTDRLVYANMRRFMNKDTYTCYPSMQTISKKCDLTVQTIQNSIRRLVKFGYIEILPEKHNNKNNIYRFKKIEDDYERFTNEFLDNKDINANEKAYLIGLQSQCYKNGEYALTSYSNGELANKLNMSRHTVAKMNMSLKAKDIMVELQTAKFDQEGFNKIVKAIDLAKIGQKVLFEIAVNHEDRLAQLEKLVEILVKENKELKKQLHEAIPQSFTM